MHKHYKYNIKIKRIVLILKKPLPEAKVFVRVKGLEPPCREALDPKSSVSTNFTTPARSANISKIV